MQTGEGDGEPVVADVLRPGYTLRGRVIRPAGVRVNEGVRERWHDEVRREWFEKDYYQVLGVPKNASRRGDQEGVPQAGAAVPS